MLAISLDLPGTDSLTQAMHAAAQLTAAGIHVDLAKLGRASFAEIVLIHLAEFCACPHILRQVRIPEAAPPALPNGSRHSSLLELHMKKLAEEHSRFQEISTRMHEEFLATSQRAFQHFHGRRIARRRRSRSKPNQRRARRGIHARSTGTGRLRQDLPGIRPRV